ncbi:hypothetical protein FGG08_002220 [Glutinoglossum americanum]|uniref:Tyrosyl-DNA phosphodiesterase n=1 Tax=Glutinoglossum americanum TaxID=1670608 RepID=A0A9P8I594_9PEZI|nr:hypothetical protein FGG08_002220 [Glutinoglossum americanum]
MPNQREPSADDLPKAKRQRVLETGDPKAGSFRADTRDHVPELFSLERSISPPLVQRNSKAPHPQAAGETQAETPVEIEVDNVKVVSSPFHLTRIRDVPDSSNIDTIRLKDILGDPMIKECWQFNYMFDIEFLMNNLDQDVRKLVQVKIIHGSWKKEDPHRLSLEETAKRYPNVQLITAYMPEAFGTHHSKMMILIRHDNSVQVVIHTANMIPFDWTNMTQAVWRSPLLPLLLNHSSNAPKQSLSSDTIEIGSGARFKHDLLAYLRVYGQGKTGKLVKELENYDFGEVRAALVASTPSRQKIGSSRVSDALWGWPGLKRVLSYIACRATPKGDRPQVSSIASLGQSNKWLAETFFGALSAASTASPSCSPVASPPSLLKPKFSVVFPTADEIRRSLDGYHSGGSIHMKIQSAAQAKQVAYMRPYLCHWASDVGGSPSKTEKPSPGVRQAGRNRAAPHIKTYVRFADSSMNRIDWAMVTSANLSMQAWGAAPNASGEVRICSWEIGVVVWPGLWKERGIPPTRSENIDMAPSFKQNLPFIERSDSEESERRTFVGIRMPYDLPLVPYAESSMPWCATSSYVEPDWRGIAYGTGDF